MSIEFVRAPLCAVWNILGDGIRLVFNAGPERLMYRSLARRLVREQSLSVIPLTSGTQAPIFDAVTYLEKIGDRESIYLLEDLFKACRQDLSVMGLEKNLEPFVASALLELYWHSDAERFVAHNLTEKNVEILQDTTVRMLFAFAIRTRLSINRDDLYRVFRYIENKRETPKSTRSGIKRI